MRAAVVNSYGGPDEVEVRSVPEPSPRPDQVLIRVRATAVNSGDARIRGARFPAGFAPFARLAFGIRRPRLAVLGGVFSGEVESVGAGVSAFVPGDQVSGMTGMSMGAHAERLAISASKLAKKPAEVSHEDAAGALFGGTAALYFLRDRAQIRTGTTVLVNGASGAVGSAAVQLANHLGAAVTGVTSTANVALVEDLGAQQVIDYKQEDPFSRAQRFDIVLDAVGNVSIATGRRLLNPGGRLILAVATLGETVRARGDVIAGSAPERVQDYETLLALLASGAIRVVIDSVHELDDIAQAHRRVDSGRKVGNVIVRV